MQWLARRTVRGSRRAPRRSAARPPRVPKRAVVGRAPRPGLPPPPPPTPRLPASPPPPRPVRLAPLGKAVCNWPFGDPQDDDFHFCEAEAEPGKPYCAEHCNRAYTRSTRGEEADEAA